MTKLLLGLIAGLAIGLLTGILIALEHGQPPDDALQVTVNAQRSQIEVLCQRLGKLEDANREAQDSVEELLGENSKLRANARRLQIELEEANSKIAAIQESRKRTTAQPRNIFVRSSGSAAAEPGPPRERRPSKAEKYLSKLRRARIERYLRILRVGQPLERQAIRELGLDKATVARINELLKDEAVRATRVLAQFLLENMLNPPEGLAELGMRQLLEKVVLEIADELEMIAQLPAKERIKLVRGEKDILDYLPQDSRVVELSYQLHQVRQETYRSLWRELPHGKMGVFQRKYLPPDDFLFEGGVNLAFGRIDWKKERGSADGE